MDVVLVILSIALSILCRWGTGTYSYSGYGKPPLFGDYEAQRHWQEITVNLPSDQWYKNSSNNDLLYWGLDYPPLTAYHSWIIGKIAQKVNGSWVELFTSRGTESVEHKLFMRYTVLISDLLLFIPACVTYSTVEDQSNLKDGSSVLISLIFYPGLYLVDYGHFQYNGVSLGFFIFAVGLLGIGRHILGSVAFVLALNYKQMELYHALPFFFYLLGYCFSKPEPLSRRFGRIIAIAVAVLGTFVLCWFPFLGSKEDILAVIGRLFPFSRGVFEDKVSNFWCALNVLIKIKNLFDQPTMVKLCAVTTLASVLPSSINLLKNPTIKRFKYSLVVCSLGFFLFSYQVHEKTILVPVASALLLVREEPFIVTWFAQVSIFSMLPLLIKDGLLIPSIASLLQFTCIMYYVKELGIKNRWQAGLLSTSCLGMAALLVCLLKVQPPPSLPDLWTVLLSVFSCCHFILYFLYFNYVQMIETSKLVLHKKAC